MDTFFTFAKENLDLISLLLGLVSVALACLSLIYELRERKKRKTNASNKLPQPGKKEVKKKKETSKNERQYPDKGSKGK